MLLAVPKSRLNSRGDGAFTIKVPLHLNHLVMSSFLFKFNILPCLYFKVTNIMIKAEFRAQASWCNSPIYSLGNRTRRTLPLWYFVYLVPVELTDTVPATSIFWCLQCGFSFRAKELMLFFSIHTVLQEDTVIISWGRGRVVVGTYSCFVLFFKSL